MALNQSNSQLFSMKLNCPNIFLVNLRNNLSIRRFSQFSSFALTRSDMRREHVRGGASSAVASPDANVTVNGEVGCQSDEMQRAAAGRWDHPRRRRGRRGRRAGREEEATQYGGQRAETPLFARSTVVCLAVSVSRHFHGKSVAAAAAHGIMSHACWLPL